MKQTKIKKMEKPIVENIKIGINDALKDTFAFSGAVDESISTEYLLTVNIAKALLKIGSRFKIQLEEKTEKFATNCMPYRLYRKKRR